MIQFGRQSSNKSSDNHEHHLFPTFHHLLTPLEVLTVLQRTVSQEMGELYSANYIAVVTETLHSTWPTLSKVHRQAYFMRTSIITKG